MFKGRKIISLFLSLIMLTSVLVISPNRFLGSMDTLAAYDAGVKWEFMYSVDAWSPDQNEAGTDDGNLYGKIFFYGINSKTGKWEAGAGGSQTVKMKNPKTGQKTTGVTSGYISTPPWLISGIQLENNSKNAYYCKKMRVWVVSRQVGSSSTKKSAMVGYEYYPWQWIETGNKNRSNKIYWSDPFGGNGYQARHPKKINGWDDFSDTLYLNPAHGDSTTYTAEVDGTFSGDSYTSTFVGGDSFWKFQGSPTLTLSVSGTSGSGKMVDWASLKQASAVSEKKLHNHLSGYTINKKAMTSFMNIHNINTIKIKARLDFPWCTFSDDILENAGNNLGSDIFERTLTIHRRALTVKNVNFYSGSENGGTMTLDDGKQQHAKNNYYFNDNSKNIIAEVEFYNHKNDDGDKTPERNSWQRYDEGWFQNYGWLGGPNSSSKAYLEIQGTGADGKAKTVKLGGKLNNYVQIHKNGKAYFNFSLEGVDIDTGTAYGLKLIFDDMQTDNKDWQNDCYVVYPGYDYTNPSAQNGIKRYKGDETFYSGMDKADTIAPYFKNVSIINEDGYPEINGWRKRVKVSYTPSEDLETRMYTLKGEETLANGKMYYVLADATGGNPQMITNRDGKGYAQASINGTTYQSYGEAPAAKNKASEIIVGSAVRSGKTVEQEIIGALAVPTDKIRDVAFNSFSRDKFGNTTLDFHKLIEGIKIDTKPPRVKAERKEEYIEDQLITKLTYTFEIQDSSKSGRVYYQFSEDGTAPLELADPNNTEAGKETGVIEGDIGRWFFVSQNYESLDDYNSWDKGNGAAVLSRGIGQNFDGYIHYYTEDALGNRSKITTERVYISTPNLEFSIMVQEANSLNPLANYTIDIITNEANSKIEYKWQHPDGGGTITDWKPYTSATEVGKGIQYDDRGNAVVLNGSCTLEVRLTVGDSNPITDSKTIVYDNEEATIRFTNTASGKYRPYHTIGVKAEDISGMSEGTATLVYENGEAIPDSPVYTLELTDAGTIDDSILVNSLPSGAYRLKATVTDRNGTVATAMSGAFYIRNAAPQMEVSVVGADETGYLVTGSADYKLKLDVKESFAYPKEEQKLFYRVTNDIANWGLWMDAQLASSSTLEITDEGYEFSGEITTPFVLKEGENELYIQTIAAPAGTTPLAQTEYAAEASYKITLDTTAPTANLILDDIHTNTEIIGSLKLIDAGSSSFLVTVPDEFKDLVSIENKTASELVPGEASAGDVGEGQDSDAETQERIIENEFDIKVRGNVDTVITAKDEFGNTVDIPLVVTGYDIAGPEYSYEEPVVITYEARVDTSVIINVSDVAKGTVSFAVIPMDKTNEALDENGKIKAEYFTSSGDTQTAGSENQNTEFDGIERAVILPDDSFDVTIRSEKLAENSNELDITYDLSLRGVTGDYVIGIRSEDSLGNVSEEIMDFVLSPQDASAQLAGTPVISPMVANTRTKVSLIFNVPVYVLPQNLIATTVSGEAENLDETNLEKARTFAASFATEQSFLASENGDYNLYVADELGRTYKMTVNVSGVSFGNSEVIDAKTVVIRGRDIESEFTPYTKEEASDWRREITGSELVTPGGVYIAGGTSEDQYLTVVEVTAPDGYVLYPDGDPGEGYYDDDGNWKGSWGWYDRENDKPLFYMADDDLSDPVNPKEHPQIAGYTKLIYRLDTMVEESEDVNGNPIRDYPEVSEITIPLRYRSAVSADGTWEETTVTTGNIDNSPPIGEFIVTPGTVRGERTDEYYSGEPLKYTLGNVMIEGTITDAQTGVGGLYISVYPEDDTYEGDGYNFDIDFTKITSYPYIISSDETEGLFSVSIEGSTTDHTSKSVYIEVYNNANIHMSASNMVGNTSFSIGQEVEGGFVIDYINKSELTDSDYTLSYEYLNSNGEWLAITNEFEKNSEGIWAEKEGSSMYYKNARVILTPSATGSERGLSASGSGVYFDSEKAAYIKELNYLANEFTFIIIDRYGYENEVSGILSMFDSTGGNIDFVYDNQTISNRAIPITITVSDEQSGIGSVELFAQSDSTPIILTGSGEGSYSGELKNVGSHIIRFTDGAGNVAEKSFTVTNIDTVAPTVKSVTWSIPPYQPDENQEDYSTKRTAGAVTAALTYSKTGVKITDYRAVAGLASSDFSVDTNNSVIRFRENGSVEVNFIDSYGNTGSDLITATQIYKDPPALVAKPVLAGDLTSVTVTFEKEMKADGVTPVDTRLLSEINVSYGGITRRALEYVEETDENGELHTVEKKAEYTFTENGTYTFSVFDDDGVSSNLTVTVSGIDRSAPTITSITWSYDYEKNENNAWVSGSVNETRDITKENREKDADGNIVETGYRIASDNYPVTNQDVKVEITTDTETTIAGNEAEEAALRHIVNYNLNGEYVFNVQKSNGTYDSYSFDVAVIDKVPPVLELETQEIIFYERLEMNSAPYDESIFRNLIKSCYDEFGGKVDISLKDKVEISYTVEVDGEPRTLAVANDRFFVDNVFNRHRPYYVTYTITDDAHNITQKTLTVRLVGLNDSVVLVNGMLPDYQGLIEIKDKDIKLELGNFVGISYASVQKGRRTMGQMKTQGTVITKDANGVYTFTPDVSREWYTFMVQTDKRDYFLIQVYYYN